MGGRRSLVGVAVALAAGAAAIIFAPGPMTSADTYGPVKRLVSCFVDQPRHSLVRSVNGAMWMTGHFITYALFGVAMHRFLRHLGRGSFFARALWCTAGGLALGTTQELVQLFLLTRRHPRARDVLIDVCGVIAGQLVLWAAQRRRWPVPSAASGTRAPG